MQSLEELRERAKMVELYSTERHHNRMFLLDVSDSMSGKKLECAKTALDLYKSAADGLILFGDKAHYISGDLGNILTSGLTALLPAIKLAMAYMPTRLIIITDGMPNKDGQPEDVITYVSSLTGIRIDLIGISRGDDGASWDIDPIFIEKLALMTGGRSIIIKDPTKLSNSVKLLCAPGTIQL